MNLLPNDLKIVRIMEGGLAHLNDEKKRINELNVFPIPDGDTGDNLYATLLEGVRKLKSDEEEAKILATFSHGMLLGARGNSGVILSKIGSGLSRGFIEKGFNPQGLVYATECAVKDSYEAVMHPKEGTMLTVFREASAYANQHVDEETTLLSYLNDFIEEGRRSVEDTPNHLDVLKEAGVVDSGGVGLISIAEGMKNVLEGKDFINSGISEPSHESIDLSLFNEYSELSYGYCTEFLLQLQWSKVDISNLNRDTFPDYLKEHGDSVVSFFDGNIFKVHVHTKTPGEILNHYQNFGEFLTVKIENMNLQHSSKTEKERKEGKKPLSVLAVAQGEGVEKLFFEMGADAIVHGGSGANPSVEDFVSAFRSTQAEKIIVLPNNGNILLAAREAAKLYTDSEVYVIDSHDIGQGYAALSSLDRSCKNMDVLLSAMEEAMDTVETYAVSCAAHASTLNGKMIEEGDYFAFSSKDKVHALGPNRREVALDLITKTIGPCDVLLVLLGQACSEEEGRSVIGECQNILKNTEIILKKGDQPLYDYLLIKE